MSNSISSSPSTIINHPTNSFSNSPDRPITNAYLSRLDSSSSTPRRDSTESVCSASSSSSSGHSTTTTDSDRSTLHTPFYSPSSSLTTPQASTPTSLNSTVLSRRQACKQPAWIHDDAAIYDLAYQKPLIRHSSSSPSALASSASWIQDDGQRRPGPSVRRPTRPPPLPLLSYEPSESSIRLSEGEEAYEIEVWLPSFSPDSITVSQHEDGSIHIVADQLMGHNSGHFERLCHLEDSARRLVGDEDGPSRMVTSSFDETNQVLIVRTLKRFVTGRAVVCGNGSGLTGNKTYRLLL